MESRKINDDLRIDYNNGDGKTVITLIDNDKRIIMFDQETNEYFWAEYRVNDDYVVVFSRGCMVNNIPLVIESVYDIREKRLVKLNSKTQKVFENMLVTKCFIDNASIIAIINKWNVPEEDRKEIDEAIDYLTNGNESITTNQVIEYIFKCYPGLKKFACYPTPFDIYRYKSIRRTLNESGGHFFHIMPQRIDDKIDIKARKKKESNH